MEVYDLDRKDDRASVSGLRINAMGHLLLPTLAAFAIPAAFGVNHSTEMPVLIVLGWASLSLSAACNLMFISFVPWWVKNRSLGVFLDCLFGLAIGALFLGVLLIIGGVFFWVTSLSQVCDQIFQ